MGRPFLQLVEDDDAERLLCRNCTAEIAAMRDLVWSGVMGDQQPAYLLSSVTNTWDVGAEHEEQLSSGRYTLVDVACRSCGTTLGWRYVQCSAGPEMMYKQGCSLLEQRHLRATPSRNSLEAARQHIQSMSRGSGAGPSQAQQGSGQQGAGRPPAPRGGNGGGAGNSNNNNNNTMGRPPMSQRHQQHSALHARLQQRHYRGRLAHYAQSLAQSEALRAMSRHATQDTYVREHDAAECMDLAALMLFSQRASQEWQAALDDYHATTTPLQL